jgi:hypothetical protein
MKKCTIKNFICVSLIVLITKGYAQKQELAFVTPELHTFKSITQSSKRKHIAISDSIPEKKQSHKMYVSIGGGYGLTSAPNSGYAGTTTTSSNPTMHEISNSSGSFGRGIQFGGTFGYMFTQNMSAELNVGYLLGSKITHTETSSRGLFDEEKVSGNMLRLAPSIKLSVGKKNIQPYLRFGLVIGLIPKITSVYTYTNVISPYTEEDQITYSGGTSIGFSAGLGANYKLNDRIGVFVEFSLISQAWAPTKSVMTKATVNGVDQLPLMTISQKEKEFVNSYEQGIYDPNVPTKSLKTYMPFSSIGINAGVLLSIGK